LLDNIKMDLTKAILSLRPGAQWMLRDEHYAGLEWTDTEQTKPTEAEVTAEVARLQAEYDANEYQRLRKPEYPPLADLADAIYWAAKGDNTKLDNYYAACEAVKLKYPKS